VDEGRGPAVLVVHGGLSDESPWAKVAAELAPRFRVVRIRRRLYRPELPVDPATDFALETADVLALAKGIGSPCVLVGHSSGAVVALETLATDPSPFRGAVLYEPPIVLDAPLGNGALDRARAACARHRRGRALTVFLRDMVEIPGLLAVAAGVAAAVVPAIRVLVPRQLDDVEAINRLGRRLDAYASIRTPTLLLTGRGRRPTFG
jgi:pimeloyl-ACP methyl ester carboxylesterase